MSTLERKFAAEYRHLTLVDGLKLVLGNRLVVKPVAGWQSRRSGSRGFDWLAHMTHYTAGTDTGATNSLQWCIDKKLVQFYIGNEDTRRADGKAVVYVLSNGRMGHPGKGNYDVISGLKRGVHPDYARHKSRGTSYAGYGAFSGVEIEASGQEGTKYTEAKYEAAWLLAAALMILGGKAPEHHIHHAQWTLRKVDWTPKAPSGGTSEVRWVNGGAPIGAEGTVDYVTETAKRMALLGKLVAGKPTRPPAPRADVPSTLWPDRYMTGADVDLARQLVAGLNPGPYSRWFVETKVKPWQRAAGLAPDGIIGARTWSALLPGAK